MDKLRLLVLALTTAFVLVGCSKASDPTPPPVPPVVTPPTDDPKDPPAPPTPEGQDPKQDPTPDIIALESLGLKPLDLAPEDYPAIIEIPFKDPESWGPSVRMRYDHMNRLTFGYARPNAIIKFFISGGIMWSRLDSGPWWSAALGEKGIDHKYEDRPGVYDSLALIHGDRPLAEYNRVWGVTPYDVRHVRIAHDGVDLSPLFELFYVDMKEVMKAGTHSAIIRRFVRLSDVGMDVLDWLIEGNFGIIPLTDDHPHFTIYFVMADGEILSREVIVAECKVVEFD